MSSTSTFSKPAHDVPATCKVSERRVRNASSVACSAAASVSMASFAVALEHPVIVPVVAVHVHIARLGRLLGLEPFTLAMPVPAGPVDELLILTFQQLLFGF